MYEVQSSLAEIHAIPKTNIKAPNTICAMANPRKPVALYSMTLIKLARNRTFDHTPRDSKLQNPLPGNLRAFDCRKCLGVGNVTLHWLGWGI